MMCPPINANFILNLPNLLILLKHTRFKPVHSKSITLTNILNLVVGDLVWLPIPTAGKLNTRWEGGWTVESVQGLTTYTISNSSRIRTVHINHLQPRIQAVDANIPNQLLQWKNWEPPQVVHDVVDSEPNYPARIRRLPTCYQA